MGEMAIKGYAERRVECDVVEYTLCFKADGITIPEAVKAVNTELEHFLEIMEKSGVTAGKFELEDNSTSEKYNSEEEEKPFYSKRKISIRMPLSTQSINNMMQYIAEYKLNVDLSEEYYCSDMAEIHKELLREAVADSRNKAELIASFTGQKIKGIKSVITNYAEYERELLRKRDQELGIHKIGETHIARANRISSPTTDQEETVEVIWLIED